MRDPSIFELSIDRRDYDMRYVLRWRSRIFGIDRSLAIRESWDAAPRHLAEFIERLVGDTVRSWAELQVDGREMAQALGPMWEREIYRHMERLEYEGRRRRDPPMYFDEMMARIRPDQLDALRYGVFDYWAEPKEDPKAKEKAKQILMRNLDAGQLKSFKKDGSFRVTAKDGKVYTIKTARSFNVVAEDGTKYCGQLADCPVEDQMLAQKLLLQHEPDKFFKNANVSPAMPTGDMGFIQSGSGANAWSQVIFNGPRIVGWDTSS